MAINNGFKKAEKSKIFAKILLIGASGSGKSYSALRLATGIARSCGSRVAAIDTENGRIRYYANEFDFDDMQLEAPYTPETYIEAIEMAQDAGYKVLLIDSISHEWKYCTDTVNKMSGNSFTNWGKMTPRHDAFMEKILQSDLHIIATARGKDTYVLEDKNGKQVPKKVGLGATQRDGVEYEYTITFNLDQENHVATASKDNTHLFENKYEVLTEKDGEKIYEWANSGTEMVKKPTPKPTRTLETVIEEIDILAKSLVNRVDKELIYKTIQESCGKLNYNNIEDIDVAKKTLDALKGLNK